MGESGPQDDFDGGKNSLRLFAEEIELKFQEARGADIVPGMVDAIAKIAVALGKIADSQDSKKILQDIADTCYSAISLYREPQNRNFYYKQLRALKGLIDAFLDD